MAKAVDNSGIKLKRFSYQLTKWLPKEKLESMECQFNKKMYGKDYVIRNFSKHRGGNKYAIFTQSKVKEEEFDPMTLPTTLWWRGYFKRSLLKGLI